MRLKLQEMIQNVNRQTEMSTHGTVTPQKSTDVHRVSEPQNGVHWCKHRE